jgi:hypothetical protein
MRGILPRLLKIVKTFLFSVILAEDRGVFGGGGIAGLRASFATRRALS